MHSELLHTCLSRLIPHVDVSRVALTGGVAIGVHVHAIGGDGSRMAAAEDLDFVAADMDAIRETATAEFLVSHFHLPQPGSAKLLIQLVDPVPRLRLDFFSDAQQALGRASIVEVDGVPLRVLDPHDILDHKLALLTRASATDPVEEKHYADAILLAAICGRKVPPVPASHLGGTLYSQNLEERCVRCQGSLSSTFPLAPKRAILDVLGYV